MEMQGLKPRVLMGKLKQHLPPEISSDNDLFLAMFLIWLPPSMRGKVGAGAHETAAAMVTAADALWDAWGGHEPTVAAASTQRSRSPAPSSGKRGDKRGSNARPKSDGLTNDRYFLVDSGAPVSIVPCSQNSNPSGPLLKGADGQPIPSWGFIRKTVQFQGKLFT
jgi:hypothetical protein